MARRVLTGEKLEKELERLSLMREFERQYEDCAFICGIDEAAADLLQGRLRPMRRSCRRTARSFI